MARSTRLATYIGSLAWLFFVGCGPNVSGPTTTGSSGGAGGASSSSSSSSSSSGSAGGTSSSSSSSGTVTCTSDAQCDDGILCNGAEVCDPTGVCQAGAPPVCPSNGVACATMVCDPVIDACAPIPDDGKCPGGQTCDPDVGCSSSCEVRTCNGKIYACGNCLDDDGDGLVDAADPDCVGPCDNNEQGFYLSLPGVDLPKCDTDCYFDPDSGHGNDGCNWDHRCDPLSVTPDYNPEWWNGSLCAYNPTFKITPTLTCDQAKTTQSQSCLGYCGPLVPNGCDCFGCCAIPVPNTNTTVTVWLGSEDGNGNGSCSLANLTDPKKCAPCTQVQGACLNPCEHCELCLGKTTLPSDCATQTCPAGKQRCGLPGQAFCPAGEYCVTGCCQPVPM